MKRVGTLALLCALMLTACVAYAHDAIPCDKRAMVNNPNPKDKLFLRPGPSRDDAPLGLYYNGTPLEVLEVAARLDWVKVRVGPLVGYMMKKYLAFGEDCDRVRNVSPIVYIEAPETPLLTLPDWDSECIGRYPSGMAATVMGVDPEWIHVWIDGSTGFMPVDGLSSVDEAEEILLHTRGYNEYPYGGRPNGPGDQLAYRQTVRMHPSESALELTFWGSYDADGRMRRLDTASIVRDGILLQEIPLYIENGDWACYAEDFISVQDVNFDGYIDFMICRSFGAYNHYYDYWTWNPESHRFYANEAFNRLDAYPVFFPNEKRISCGSKDGAATHYEFEYQVENGLPVLVERRDIRYKNNTAYTVTQWQRQNGKLVKVGQWNESVE